MANNTIIIAGPRLPQKAMEMAQQRGAKVIPLEPYTPPDEIAKVVAAEQAAAIIVRMGHITPTVMDASSSLKVIVKFGVGVDTIDVDAAAERGIPVLITQANTQSVAEHTLALLFAVARNVPFLDRRMREGNWDKASAVGGELLGKSLGVVGLGAVARAFIKLVQPLNMTLRAYDPYVKVAPLGVELVDHVDALLPVSDVISLHCPLTEQTRHLIGRPQFAGMRRNAYLINTARGGLIDVDALVEALKSGQIAGAGLDTFPQEPPPVDSALWSLPNLVVTPHVGANTNEARERVALRAMEQVLDCLDGHPVDEAALVNPAAMSAARSRPRVAAAPVITRETA